MSTSTGPKNKQGFPLKECGRCGGTGHFSYNSLDGSRCFGCSGTGWKIAPRAAKAWIAYREAVKVAKSPSIADVKPGDFIRWGKDKEWREVASVEIDKNDERGWSLRNGEQIAGAWAAVVTYTDGTTKDTATFFIVDRKGTVDPATFLATVEGTPL